MAMRLQKEPGVFNFTCPHVNVDAESVMCKWMHIESLRAYKPTAGAVNDVQVDAHIVALRVCMS